MRDSDSNTPLSNGVAPPDRPVPEPRATIGTPSRLHANSTACTSDSVRGRTTTSGRCRNVVSASHSYGRRSLQY